MIPIPKAVAVLTPPGQPVLKLSVRQVTRERPRFTRSDGLPKQQLPRRYLQEVVRHLEAH